MPKIYFEKEDIEYNVQDDQNILDVIQELNIPVTSHCGGRGSCVSCIFVLVSGSVSSCVLPNSTNEFLACQSRPLSDSVIHVIDIDAENRLSVNITELSDQPLKASPFVVKDYMTIQQTQYTPLTLSNLKKQVENHLSSVLIEDHSILQSAIDYVNDDMEHDITLVLQKLQGDHYRLLNIEDNITYHVNHSIAFFISNKLVSACLIDIYQERIVRKESITFSEENQQHDQQAIIAVMNQLLSQLTHSYKISPNDLYSVVFAFEDQDMVFHFQEEDGYVSLHLMGLSCNPHAIGMNINDIMDFESIPAVVLSVLALKEEQETHYTLLLDFGSCLNIMLIGGGRIYVSSVKNNYGSLAGGFAGLLHYRDQSPIIKRAIDAIGVQAQMTTGDITNIAISGDFGMHFDFDQIFDLGFLPQEMKTLPQKYFGSLNVYGCAKIALNNDSLLTLKTIEESVLMVPVEGI